MLPKIMMGDGFIRLSGKLNERLKVTFITSAAVLRVREQLKAANSHALNIQVSVIYLDEYVIKRHTLRGLLLSLDRRFFLTASSTLRKMFK